MTRLLVLAALLLTSCARPAPPAEPAGPSLSQQLAKMDPRKPVPLLPMMAAHQKRNMQGHLVSVQKLTAALGEERWEDAAAAAKELGSSPEMQQQCERMGAAAEGFTDRALDFHRRADAMATAIAAKDTAGALSALSHTLQACTDCHATFRQELVAEVP